MPIVDIQFVCPQGMDALPVPAQTVADALGRVFGSVPGRTWVRVGILPGVAYAENETVLDESGLPVFVTVLHAHPAEGDAFANEIRAVTQAVAACSGRPEECVHVQYSPPAAGRQAFGGILVR